MAASWLPRCNGLPTCPQYALHDIDLPQPSGLILCLCVCARADEKYNFERLQATTALNKQPLMCPQALELSPPEELTIRWVA